jgi:hypothetical protein
MEETAIPSVWISCLLVRVDSGERSSKCDRWEAIGEGVTKAGEIGPQAILAEYSIEYERCMKAAIELKLT